MDKVFIAFYTGSNTEPHIVGVYTSEWRARAAVEDDVRSNFDDGVTQEEVDGEVKRDYEVKEFPLDSLADVIDTPDALRS